MDISENKIENKVIKVVKVKNCCLACNRVLVPIGRKRLNGTITHDDWKDRKYHKKCFKEKYC